VGPRWPAWVLEGCGPCAQSAARAEGARSPSAAFNLDFSLLASGSGGKPVQMGVLSVTTSPPAPALSHRCRTQPSGPATPPTKAADYARGGEGVANTTRALHAARFGWLSCPLPRPRPAPNVSAEVQEKKWRAVLCGLGASSPRLARPSGLSAELSPRP
jgi:hypothetical protein